MDKYIVSRALSPGITMPSSVTGLRVSSREGFFMLSIIRFLIPCTEGILAFLLVIVFRRKGGDDVDDPSFEGRAALNVWVTYAC